MEPANGDSNGNFGTTQRNHQIFCQPKLKQPKGMLPNANFEKKQSCFNLGCLHAGKIRFFFPVVMEVDSLEPAI